MRILVTGANGQLGNEMQVLAKENPQHTYYFTDVQELDICDKQAVWTYMAEKQIELVVNCAAYTAVDKAEDNQELAYKLNCEAPKQLASAAQANGAAMIQVSTDYVFDGTAHIPYTEDCDPCPDSVYGTTKLEGEKEVMNHCEQAVVIRTAWLYSTFGNNFVKTMIRLGKSVTAWELFSTRSELRRMPMTWHGPSMLLLIKVLFAVSTISAMREFVPGMISQ